jgi:hypothetical protein
VLRSIGAAALCVVLANCATAPTTLSNVDSVAGPSSPQAAADDAILVLAIAGPISVGGQYEVRQVNMDTRAFAADAIQLIFGAWGVGDAMRADNPDGAPPPAGPQIALLVKRVPAGDYAVSGMSWNTFNGYSSGIVSGCFNDTALVMRLAPGTISVVNSGDVTPPGGVTRLPASVDDARIASAFQQARVNYPNLLGEPVFAQNVGRIRWSGEGGFFDPPCYGRSRMFDVITSSSTDLEAARAAALEAARRNLSAGEVNAAPAKPSEPSPEGSATDH